MMRAPLRTRRTNIAALLAVPAFVLLLAACAPASGAAETPASSGGSSLSEAEFSAARDAYDMKVAQCLRDKGFEVQDPQPGKGITEDIPNEAGTACYKELGDPPVFGKKLTDAEQMEDMMKTVECLRGKGYDVADPTGETGIQGLDAVSEADLATCYS